LKAGIRAVGDRQIRRKNEFRKSKCTITGLVEAFDEGDGKSGRIITAQPKIDDCISPKMARLED